VFWINKLQLHCTQDLTNSEPAVVWALLLQPRQMAKLPSRLSKSSARDVDAGLSQHRSLPEPHMVTSSDAKQMQRLDGGGGMQAQIARQYGQE
jgi:hypothetical protein